MLAMFRRIFSYKIFPFSFTLFTILMLCLPGSMVPGTGIFALKNLDKIVHVFLFGMNVLLWGWHFSATVSDPKRLKIILIMDVAVIVTLGIVLEYVQLYFIPNRSFDVYDILADTVGAVLAGIWLLRN